ncbi:cathepsin D precursor, putative [Perkinsus marinus ATCC 50983]|uniref:Cathepsin D, putative n=1 Tax=Perkinsus marinus (strain ATCC 50983 / TXsc) TaxID=423536 RepID=C5LJC4_PERM5|nr:cathepsin D precursor, putative [Perkinsus marinus ATCC 50983]EER03169.1 cathepsin D precursor, putative [Perkinsus marinus ATCC 50983]|eukprot:XP_002771353.1 cathepsin D precursor, putative [Perkinsus marinus ATCC 50983]
MFKQDPPPTESEPISSLGLSLQSSGRTIPSFIGQLRSTGKIPSNTFAFYLSSAGGKAPFNGELLVGGGDASKYVPPLQLIPFSTTVEGDYSVELGSVKVNDAPQITTPGDDILLDSGTNFFHVSPDYYDDITEDVKEQADKIAGRPVDLEYDAGANLWRFSCVYMNALPPLSLGLGPQGTVPLKLTYLNYALDDNGSCFLLIKKGEEDEAWMLPAKAVIGNYYEFQPDQRRLGTAPAIA